MDIVSLTVVVFVYNLADRIDLINTQIYYFYSHLYYWHCQAFCGYYAVMHGNTFCPTPALPPSLPPSPSTHKYYMYMYNMCVHVHSPYRSLSLSHRQDAPPPPPLHHSLQMLFTDSLNQFWVLRISQYLKSFVNSTGEMSPTIHNFHLMWSCFLKTSLKSVTLLEYVMRIGYHSYHLELVLDWKEEWEL